jgi:hypothetical protein
MQLKKLAVICNACFWLTLIFQVWEHARDIHQLILNSVVVLGILAVLINTCWVIIDLYAGSKRSIGQKKVIVEETTETINSRSKRWFNFFNLFSFTSQLVLLAIKLV